MKILFIVAVANRKSLQLLFLRRKMELKLLKAKLKLQKMFGMETPAPKAAMLAVLRSKPLPVPVELGSEMGKQGGKINEKRVMDFLLPLKTQRV